MKSTILLLAFLAIVSLPALGTPWFGVTDAYIQQLDEDSYRLRVSVGWDDISYFNSEYGIELPMTFNAFEMSLLGTSQYNATINAQDGMVPVNDPGNWSASLALFIPMPLVPSEFGYDFDVATPLSGSYTMDYSAFFAGGPIPIYDEAGSLIRYDYEDASFSGSFTAGVVPEPATILLVGFGLVGAGVVRRFRNRNV